MLAVVGVEPFEELRCSRIAQLDGCHEAQHLVPLTDQILVVNPRVGADSVVLLAVSRHRVNTVQLLAVNGGKPRAKLNAE